MDHIREQSTGELIRTCGKTVDDAKLAAEASQWSVVVDHLNILRNCAMEISSRNQYLTDLAPCIEMCDRILHLLDDYTRDHDETTLAALTDAFAKLAQ